jgi:transposase
MEIYSRSIHKDFIDRFIGWGKEVDPDLKKVAPFIWEGYKFYIVAAPIKDRPAWIQVSVSAAKSGRTDWEEMNRLFGKIIGEYREPVTRKSKPEGNKWPSLLCKEIAAITGYCERTIVALRARYMKEGCQGDFLNYVKEYRDKQTRQQTPDYCETGMSVTNISAKYGFSKPDIYRYAFEWQKKRHKLTFLEYLKTKRTKS